MELMLLRSMRTGTTETPKIVCSLIFGNAYREGRCDPPAYPIIHRKPESHLRVTFRQILRDRSILEKRGEAT